MTLKVTHIITGLSGGGAEGVLVRLCMADHGRRCEHNVISLTSGGQHVDTLVNAGIGVTALGMNAGPQSILKFFRLVRLLKDARPDVVQTWMYHADLLGGLAARLAGVRTVFWGVRSTATKASGMKRSTLFVARLCGLLSRFVPRKIVVCAENAVASHESLGYRSDKIQVIPNGYDFNRFSSGPSAGDALRNEIGLAPDTPLLGMIGRYTPQKDHANLLQALGMLEKRGHAFHAVLVGSGLDSSNVELLDLARELGIEERLSWLGERSDVPAIMQALDLHLLSSRLEGFPNVLAEAMASGTPCVSTDVGDARLILGDLGWLAPRENSEELANAIAVALEEKQERPEDWNQRRSRCRDRVEGEFSLQKMVDSYFDLWQSAAPSHD